MVGLCGAAWECTPDRLWRERITYLYTGTTGIRSNMTRSDDPCRSGKSELQDHRSNISEHFNLRRASLAGKVQNNHKHGKDIVEKRVLKNGNNDRREKGRTVNEVSRV
nr:PREDICTED: uncharacterized protein LOC105664357 [Megachile rotundata]